MIIGDESPLNKWHDVVQVLYYLFLRFSHSSSFRFPLKTPFPDSPPSLFSFPTTTMSEVILQFASESHRNTYLLPSRESSNKDIYYKISTSGKVPDEVTSIYRRSRISNSNYNNRSPSPLPSPLQEDGFNTDVTIKETDRFFSGKVESKLIARVEWKYPNGDDVLRLGGSDAFPQKLDKWLKRRALVRRYV